MEHKELNQKLKTATAWSSVTELAAKLVTPITNAVLARLLVPEAFGVVATLTMVVSFAEIFTDAGFQKYLVQHEFRDREELDLATNVAFWTNLAFSLLLWAVIACFAEPLAALVGSPGCGRAITVMSAQIPLLAFSSIQMARFRRDMDFKGLFYARMLTSMVPLFVTVPLALLFRSYWALVAGTLARDVLNAVVLTARSRWKPELRYSFSALKDMLSFSIWSMLENITIWLTNYIGTFIVVIALNEHYLGLYKTTMSTVNGYMNIFAVATVQVLFSALSKCQNDEEMFQSVFFRFQRMASLVLFPLGFGMFVFRELAVQILLGSQWGETADFLGLWSLTSAVAIVLSYYDSEVFRSKGKPKLSVLCQVLHLVVLIPVLVLCADKGFAVLTTARSLVRMQAVAVSAVLMHFVMGIKVWKVAKNVLPTALAAFVMALCGVALRQVSDGFVWQIAAVMLCALIYIAALLLIPGGKGVLAQIGIFRKIFRLKRPREETCFQKNNNCEPPNS